jgi:hypothetical protein
MKITRRQLRRIIREAARQDDWAAKEKEIAELDPGSAESFPGARGPMTPDYVYGSLMAKQSFGPRKGLTRMDMAMDAISAGDLRNAASKVMDALWVDDPPPGASEELEDLLAGVRSEDELVSIVAEWGTRHFRSR